MKTTMLQVVSGVALCVSLPLLFGCSSNEPPASGSTDPITQASQRAIARLKSTAPNGTLSGTVEFNEEGPRTVVTIQLSGGVPGEHGMHIHQNGSCDPVDGGAALAAGAHWNPYDAGHGLPTASNHQLGDLGNITIDEKGNASLTLTSNDFYVRPGELSVVGHAVVIHEKMDDGTPPTGNAGARPGCGVIERADAVTK